MPKIRVLIVDDSVVIRRLLTDELSKDPDIEVVGSAATGKIALSKIVQTPPDVVTMDIEMPEMDGLTAVTEIRKTHPKRDEFVCEGCNVKVTLEMVNSLQTRDEIQVCHSCGRILFLDAAPASK